MCISETIEHKIPQLHKAVNRWWQAYIATPKETQPTMTEEQRQSSLQSNTLKLSFWDKVSHFGIVGFLFFIPMIFAFFHLKDALQGIPRPIKNGEVYFLIIPTILAILFYKLQSDRLNFKEIHTTLSREQLNEIIEKVGTKLKWFPEEINKDFVIAKTHPSFFSGSWGEQITILFDTNRVLVNSICDPDKKSSVVSMGRNKKNVSRLLQEIENASHQHRLGVMAADLTQHQQQTR